MSRAVGGSWLCQKVRRRQAQSVGVGVSRLHELKLRRACEKNCAPRPFVFINGGVQERKRGRTKCEEHACLRSSKTEQPYNTADRQKQTQPTKTNPTSRHPLSPLSVWGYTQRSCSELLLYEAAVGYAAYLLNRYLTYRTACTAVVAPCAAVGSSLPATTLPISGSVDYWVLMCSMVAYPQYPVVV